MRFLGKKTKMATKNNTLTDKDETLDGLKKKITVKEKQRKKADSSNSAKKQPKKRSRLTTKEKYKQKQEDQCVDSPLSTLEENEVFGQPIPELYPELSEDFKRPVDTSLADESNDQQESLVSSGLRDKERLDDSQNSSEDSQPIGIKKRRKMLIPKKFERQFENLDSDDDDDFSVLNPVHEPGSKRKDNYLSEKQAQRTGSWVQCSLPHCGKWRCLNDKVDPVKLPDKWVCSMNPDCRYNRCLASQEDFDSQDEDFDVVYSPYPEGAIVWAKLAGYPWWPGMMENDPDYGYYCETDEDSREPISYHVVFFDKDVSRAWVNTCNVRLFQADDNPEDQGSVIIRKKNFKKKVDLATEQAKQALSLPPEKRLDAYGFARRFKGPIGHQNKPAKDKKVFRPEVLEQEDIEEEEEKDEEEGEDYVHSAESRTVKSTADKPKKNVKTIKKSISKNEKAAKNKNTEKAIPGKKIQEAPVVTMNAVSEDTAASKGLLTSTTNSETPKSPIPAPSHENEMPVQVPCDVTKEKSTKEKTKTTSTKKRNGDKKTEGKKGQGKKEEKTAKKESPQADQEKKARRQPDKKPAKKLKDKSKIMQELQAQAKNVTEDVQASEISQAQPSSRSSSLQFTNMPKLIKASFKPPSKKSPKNNTSCPKPTKMPKLWKPQFICPAAAASEKASNLLKGNKTEERVQSDKNVRKLVQTNKVELKRSACDGQERCSVAANKRPLLQVKDVEFENDPVLSDEVEVELAKLDRDIEDMKKEFDNSMHPNEKKQLSLNGDDISTEDSPEF